MLYVITGYSSKILFFLNSDYKGEEQRRSKRENKLSYTMLDIGVDGVDPISLAFDWVGNNLYWIDGSYGKPVIMISDVKGLARRKIVTKVLYNPHAVALDPIRG